MPLSTPWSQRKNSYDFVIVGSGYGGAITAARVTAAAPKPSVCILERGREWPVGSFPDAPEKVFAAARNPVFNPLGLYDFLAYPDISVLQGSGLGGTSLINANVAIIPDERIFQGPAWPRSLTLSELRPFYDRARQTLAVRPHPRSDATKPDCLLKVQALERRAQELGNKSFGLEIAVNFDIDGPNAQGQPQKPCIDCGDCVTGCNVGAKNTLYMNYLPLARQQGAHIFTQAEVERVEMLSGGGWRVHARRHRPPLPAERVTFEARNVVLAAGSLGTTEILLRSERDGLSLSPKLGTQFTGNGDFFALSYNADAQINSIGFGNRPQHPWRKKGNAPGPSIVGGIRYNGQAPFEQQITVEDFSFPSAYIRSAMLAFGALAALGGAEDTDVGDEETERERRRRDNIFNPYRDDCALNHTLLYLIMGHDDAKGMLRLKRTFPDVEDRVWIEWDGVARQAVFTRINEEIRRHARALGASFMPNPLWNFVTHPTVVTAHPLGGCPVGEDYLQGAADEFGRVFSGDGSVHQGLFVADGALIPAPLAVNPFLTISALAERIADRIVRLLAGEPYPEHPKLVAVGAFDPAEVSGYREPDLERIFSRVTTQPAASMVNTGQVQIDLDQNLVRNDSYWRGFFPRGHLLNLFSTAFAAGFKKEFKQLPNGDIVGVTSDSDGRITAKNTLEEITVTKRTGNLEPGRYILLRYTEDAWRGFYDIFKAVSPDLLIGRVYLGNFPSGLRLFTFPMTRAYRLESLTVADHQRLFASGSAPTKAELDGVWEMRMVSNAVPTGVVAHLAFSHKPDGRLEARYRLFGLLEGFSEPVFGLDHFRMNDFTPFHDEIRLLRPDFMVGKYVTQLPEGVRNLFQPASLGLFQVEKDAAGKERFGFYYTLRRAAGAGLPPNPFLQPLVELRLPDGLGLRFEEEMVGHFLPALRPAEGQAGDREIEEAFASSLPPGSAPCQFVVRISARDLNEFIDSPEHEAEMAGKITFQNFPGKGEAAFELLPRKSRFNYLRVNPATGEAEMVYRLSFRDEEEKEYLFLGRKYLQKDGSGGVAGIQEVLRDYTTLFARLIDVSTGQVLGGGVLKFRTFEDVAAIGSMAEFFKSFEVTGTADPLLRARGILRFFAFTNDFITREYELFSLEADAAFGGP